MASSSSSSSSSSVAAASPLSSFLVVDGSDNVPLYNGKLIVLALALLLFALAFILALHIYAKWFWIRSPRRRHPASLRRRSPGSSSFRHDGLPTVGLDKSAIDSLPTFVYDGSLTKEGVPLECAVCLSEFQENEKGRILPKCSHTFHIVCIDKWFLSHTTCPLCRASAEMGGGLLELNVQRDWAADAQQRVMENDAVEISRNTAAAAGDLQRSLPSPGWRWRRSIMDRFIHNAHAGVQFPTNVLFWGDNANVSMHTNVVQAVHSHAEQPESVVDIATSSHRCTCLNGSQCPSSNCNNHQHQQLSSPPLGSHINAFRRLLCRDKVFPTQLDAIH